jgi:CubicO group peptidase (beta-lactamase class C family)
MIRFVITVASALLLAVPSKAHSTDGAFPSLDELRTLAEQEGVPGGAVVLVREGQPDVVLTVGIADSAGRTVTEHSVFRIASVSKVFTAAAIARLAAEGRVGLDDDLRVGRPWLETRAPREPVTLRQLLTHTGGFDDHAVGMFARSPDEVVPLAEYLRARMPERTTAPGRWSRYSNHGAALAGLVVEEMAEAPFEEAVRRLVLDPIGMGSTSFAQPIPVDLGDRLVRAFPCPDAACPPAAIDYRHTVPAGGLVTTPADMAGFMHAVLDASSPALGDGTVALLMTRAWGPHPEMPGLALALQEQPLGGRRALVHAGRSSGYTSLIALVPEAGAGLFVVTSGGTSGFGAQLVDRFARVIAVEQDWLSTSAPPTPLSLEDGQSFAGSYLLGRAARGTYERFPGHFLFADRLWVDRDGYLVRREGSVRRRYGRLGDDLFGAVDGEGRLAFERSPEGAVVAMHAADVFNGVRFPATYERLAAWESPYVMNELVSWVMGVPVIAIAAWGLLTIGSTANRRLRRRPTAKPPRRIDATGIGIAVVAVVGIVTFGFGFLARFTAMAARNPGALAYGLPDDLARFLWMPWLILVSGLALAPVTALAWTRIRSRRLLDRLLLSTILPCVLVFLLLLVHFNLLPPVR